MRGKIILAWCCILRRIINCLCYITLKLKQRIENNFLNGKCVVDTVRGLFLYAI